MTYCEICSLYDLSILNISRNVDVILFKQYLHKIVARGISFIQKIKITYILRSFIIQAHKNNKSDQQHNITQY